MRGSEHGFTKEAFNRLVVGKSPTLILVKSNYKKVFGAFTSIRWAIPAEDTLYPDKTSFLFSITQNTKHVPYRNEP